jgi:hypothetical protein
MRNKISMTREFLFGCIIIVHTILLLALTVIEAIHIVRFALGA